ncbi:uncharacterized protein K460DRAFT_411871 [Cucurbitaria berberidis CBS 394.84]|uniref:Uncharacterized protein n=1 Tax=Cucurbitaria berberidis CBS 394.84 TaxID=1168544 RepID=A0A9P4GRT1_9PLEO|nr:uncharacterized protein K460DRAFT_411871 [Cucurbitaria berberidis CBS 394.84]KAF1850104.1 hypothetical protein K460DRAFT_411871 [Cucurbitaria berberidis CBS 394.84]
MSILAFIKNSFGKRSRDPDKEPQDEPAPIHVTVTADSYVLAPRRRSVRLMKQAVLRNTTNQEPQSPPGRFPGTDNYAPKGVTTTSDERKKVKPASKAVRGLTSGIVITSTENTSAPTPPETNSSSKLSPIALTTRDAAQDIRLSGRRRVAIPSTRDVKTKAKIETATHQPFLDRRQSYPNHPNTPTMNTGERRARKNAQRGAVRQQFSTPTLSCTMPLKDLLADPNSPIAKAHKALKQAHVKRISIDEEVARLRRSPRNNVFSRCQPNEQEKLAMKPKARIGLAADTSTLVESGPNIEVIALGGRDSTESKDNPSLSQPSSDVEHQSASSVSPNEGSDGNSTTTPYSSTRSSPSRINQDVASAMTEMSTHFATQNQALSKNLAQVSEALALTNAKNLEAQRLITQLATRPPSSPAQSQPLIDPAALEQAIERKVDEHYESKLSGLWASQKQRLVRSTPLQRDYFDPRSALRKNRAVLPVEKTRSILEAHEVQYRYEIEECPLQKLLGLPRVAKQESSFYASMKNSKEDYPTIAAPSVFDRPVTPMGNGWADFQTSVSARRPSQDMELEGTGAPALLHTWKPNQGIVFSQPVHLPDKTQQPLFGAPWPRSTAPPINHAQQAALDANLDEVLRREPRNAGIQDFTNPQQQNELPKISHGTYLAAFDRFLRDNPRESPWPNSDISQQLGFDDSLEEEARNPPWRGYSNNGAPRNNHYDTAPPRNNYFAPGPTLSNHYNSGVPRGMSGSQNGGGFGNRGFGNGYQMDGSASPTQDTITEQHQQQTPRSVIDGDRTFHVLTDEDLVEEML